MRQHREEKCAVCAKPLAESHEEHTMDEWVYAAQLQMNLRTELNLQFDAAISNDLVTELKARVYRLETQMMNLLNETAYPRRQIPLAL